MRHSRHPAVLLVLAVLLAWPAAAWGVALDGATPPLGPSPLNVSVAAGTSAAYRVPLTAGETLVVSLSAAPGSPATLDLDLYLYGPGMTQTVHGSAIARSVLPPTGYPETITYRVPSTGTYYLEVFSAEGSGSGVMNWAVVPEPLLPVHRFYNVRTGTHFYTPDENERARVASTMQDTYSYDGVAYYTKASSNYQYLYRFFNKRTGSHFYTASDAERDSVLANLGGTFSYDGPTYLVSSGPDGGKTPVYRFYNRRNGAHFYTADPAERDNVLNTLGYLYDFEGAAFWIGR